MKKTLFELVNDVENEETFLTFISALRQDRIKKKSRDWNNDNIEDFLEAAYEWGKDSRSGLEYYEKPDNPWKRCAQIIYMGKIYE